jgi:GNAT superfamily N-acetyltransferase
MKIRKFKKSDALKTYHVIKDSLNGKLLYLRYKPYELVNNFSKKWDIYVAESGGKIVATGSTENNKIYAVYVKQKHQKTGIGKKIMSFLEKNIKNKGYSKAEIHSNMNAYNFYKKLGYKKIREKFESGKKASIIMRKKL